MLKKIFILLLIVISFLFLATTIRLNSSKENRNIFSNLSFNNILDINMTNGSSKEIKEEIIGKLIIKKININNNLYKTTSKRNNVNKNITILENSIPPNKDDSIMFIAAHSGTGRVAYFRNLNKLEIGDIITLIYDNETYNYEVKNYWEEKKDGDISVFKEDKKQLILTTCSPDNEDMQLVINCVLK